MKRGVISLNNDQLSLLQPMLIKLPKLLSQKLASSSSIEQLKIELNEEDVEMLLDILPIPSVEEGATLQSLRLALQDFLQFLRTGN